MSLTSLVRVASHQRCILCRMCVSHCPGSNSSAACDAPDTSGGTPHTSWRTVWKRPHRNKINVRPITLHHLTSVNTERQVTTPTSPNNIFAGSTESCSREKIPFAAIEASRLLTSGFLFGLVGREPTIGMTWAVPLPSRN